MTLVIFSKCYGSHIKTDAAISWDFLNSIKGTSKSTENYYTLEWDPSISVSNDEKSLC